MRGYWVLFAVDITVNYTRSWHPPEMSECNLSHAQVQMARELGLNPGKLGKISNHRQEPWKAPLPQFIEHLYLNRFGRERPQFVTPAENWGRPAAAKKPEDAHEKGAEG
jgi:hypothetical protein